VRAPVPLAQVPVRAVAGRAGRARHTPAEAWLGRPPPRLRPVLTGRRALT